MLKLCRHLGVVLLLVGVNSSVLAGTDFPTFQGSWENDTKTLSRGARESDRFYTNGARAGLMWSPSDQVPSKFGLAHFVLKLMPFVSDTYSADAQANGFGYAVGQNMYSPSRINLPIPDPTDRPYGGWSYVGVVGTHLRYLGSGDEVGGVATRRYTKEARTVELDLGAIGPSSGAAETQKWVHAHLCDCQQPLGWGSQIKNEPGVHASYDWAWRIGEKRYERERLFDMSTSLGASAGNVFTNGRAGGVVRMGWNLSDELAPDANIRSFGAGDTWTPFPMSLYGYARAESRAVVRNVFLDGNLFRTGRHVDALPLVADWEYGFVADVFAMRVSWRHVMRSREFVGQQSPEVYGVVNVGINLLQTGRSIRRAFAGGGS